MTGIGHGVSALTSVELDTGQSTRILRELLIRFLGNLPRVGVLARQRMDVAARLHDVLMHGRSLGIADAGVRFVDGLRQRRQFADTMIGLGHTEEKKAAVGDMVTAAQKRYTGFVLNTQAGGTLVSGTVPQSGALVLKLYYDRNNYALTLNGNGGTWTQGGEEVDARTTSERYGAAVTLPVPSRVGYTFVNWNPAPSVMPSRNTTCVAVWRPNATTTYTVNTHYETLTGGYLTIPVTKTTHLVNQTVELTPESLTGWAFDAGKSTGSGIAVPEGTLTLNMYYNRVRYALTFDAMGGTGGMSKQVAYGASISQPTPVRAGYRFTGWDAEVPSAMPASDLTFTARWEGLPAAYTVEHYQENLDGTFGPNPYETVVMNGKTGETVTAAYTAYEGFDADTNNIGTVLSGTVRGDDSLTLKVYYLRKTFLLTIEIENGETYTELVKYGAPFHQQTGVVGKVAVEQGDRQGATAVTIITTPGEGYVKSGVTDGNGNAISDQMPPSSYTIRVGSVAEAKAVGYTVNHRYPDGTVVPEHLNGEDGKEVTALAKNTADYVFDAANANNVRTGKLVKGGTPLVLALHYKAKGYPLTLAYDANVLNVSVTPSQTEIAVGTSVTVKATVKDAGYAFDGWVSAYANVTGTSNETISFAMPAGEVKLTARVKAKTFTANFALTAGGKTGTPQGALPASYPYDAANDTRLPVLESTDPNWGFAGWLIDGKGPSAVIPKGTKPADGAQYVFTPVFKKIVTLNFAAKNGTFVGGVSVVTLTGLEDAKVTPPTPSAVTGFTWAWDVTPPTTFAFGDDGKTYTAQWTADQGGGGGGGGGDPVPPPMEEKIPVTNATLVASSLDVEAGKTAVIRASLEPANANDYTIAYASGDTTKATVSDNGTVTGVAEGKTTVTVTIVSGGKTFTLTCEVNVKPKAEPDPDDPDPDDPTPILTVVDTLSIGNKKNTALPVYSGAVVTWTSDDERIDRSFEQQRERQALAERGRLTLMHYQNLLDYEENDRERRHEMKHHMSAIAALLDGGETERARAYIRKVAEQATGAQPVSLCRNLLVSAVVGRYLQAARDRGIDASAHILVPAEIRIADEDVCAYLTNLLENALEACEKCDGDQARYIRFTMEKQGNFIYIGCRNSASEKAQLNEDGLPGTTKGNSGSHGYGMIAMRRVAEKYNSVLLIQQTPGEFSVMTNLQDQ